ncbi:MAG: hypothetical protein HZB33_15395 [Nitrospirae bacterium]|nr:hypothetical protein [Nitrospirota bacterium]
MKLFDAAAMALEKGGECVLGSAELNTHACYFIYGRLRPGEKGRVVSPGKGHEEIFCLVSGRVRLETPDGIISLSEGQAFHICGDESLLMDNEGDTEAVYVMAGGHSSPHGHH